MTGSGLSSSSPWEKPASLPCTYAAPHTDAFPYNTTHKIPSHHTKYKYTSQTEAPKPSQKTKGFGKDVRGKGGASKRAGGGGSDGGGSQAPPPPAAVGSQGVGFGLGLDEYMKGSSGAPAAKQEGEEGGKDDAAVAEAA